MTLPDANAVRDTLPADSHDDWRNASKYLPMFIDEARQTLDEITDALLAWEAVGHRGGAQPMLVAAHRLKGSAASIGLNRVAAIAHLTEDILQKVIDDGGDPTPEISNALLSFADCLREYIEQLQSGRTEEPRFDALAERLKAIVESNDHKPAAAQDSIDTSVHRRVDASVCADQRDTTFVGRVVFEPNLPLVGMKARLLYEKLANLGSVRHFQPSVDGIEELEELTEVTFGVVAESTIDAIRNHIHIAGIERMTIEPLAAQAGVDMAAEPVAKTTPAIKPAETLRVDVERLDRLMNHAGQLVLCKSRLARLTDDLKQATAGNRRDEMLVGQLEDALHRLGRVGEDIQQGMMDLRMVPIGPLLMRFHRVVRDVARGNGKDIRLVISGENTELDKRMIDELGDPLIHLVRNAADHGIDTPEQRSAADKLPQGTISIEAFHRGGNVIIRLSDDGRGIDADRLVEKALEKGLITTADAAALDQRDKLRLVWTPGLSTAEKVSNVSGRGMGMDIVRAKIEQLNGSIELESEPGRGTVATIKLPLTLAILPSLMVEIDGQPTAVPMESVAEVVSVERRDVTDILGCPTIVVRNRLVPIVTLTGLFERNAKSALPDVDDDSAHTILVIGHNERQLGLIVDRVYGEEDVVVKSLAANWQNIPGVAGASIFGDGRVFLILDAVALIENLSQNIDNNINNLENAT